MAVVGTIFVRELGETAVTAVPVACPIGRRSVDDHGHSQTRHGTSHLQRSRSEHLANDLCKQGVRGSSPLSSTCVLSRDM
jgi:hypothetical protein